MESGEDPGKKVPDPLSGPLNRYGFCEPGACGMMTRAMVRVDV